ncbi:hypothetical protein [Kocuria massiliensis]|nr:hypothetical protein [Kocuria massiliensis]
MTFAIGFLPILVTPAQESLADAVRDRAVGILTTSPSGHPID